MYALRIIVVLLIVAPVERRTAQVLTFTLGVPNPRAQSSHDAVDAQHRPAEDERCQSDHQRHGGPREDRRAGSHDDQDESGDHPRHDQRGAGEVERPDEEPAVPSLLEERVTRGAHQNTSLKTRAQITMMNESTPTKNARKPRPTMRPAMMRTVWLPATARASPMPPTMRVRTMYPTITPMMLIRNPLTTR